MNYIADTHIVLWSLIEPSRIDPPTLRVLEDADHTKYVSTVTYWEIALKYALGKLHLGVVGPEEILVACVEAGYNTLALDPAHAAGSHNLPQHQGHKDPFDRLLIWQCLRLDFVMLTADSAIRDYARDGLKLIGA